jgi:hypothetical protein
MRCNIIFSASQRHRAWDIRSENRPVVPDGASFVTKAWEMRVQSTRSMLLVFVFPHAYFHEGEVQLVFRLLIFIQQCIGFCFHTLQERVLRWTKPPTTSLLLDTLADLARGKSELIAENALLRHQLMILRRQIKRPIYRKADRLLLVVLARMVRTWKQALFLVQEDDTSAASIVSSSACSGSTHQKHMRASRSSRPRRSA